MISSFKPISIHNVSSCRPFHGSLSQRLPPPASTSSSPSRAVDPKRLSGESLASKPALTALEKAEAAAKKAREDLKLQEDKARANVRMGGLSANSVFAEEEEEDVLEQAEGKEKDDLADRNFTHMARVLNPRPNARARWQRQMVIRHIRRGGRLTTEMKIARTERKHLAKSHFFKTSMKKLAPLARQIAGKSVDEAILQMRFSKKKVAQEVREHLTQARNEAIVLKGMGVKLDSNLEAVLPTGPMILDPSITPPGTDQNPTKTRKRGLHANETDIYIAEAWTNPGPYGREPEYRARGRVNILRPPHTGLSVVLKEEKTRTREKAEKDVKAIKKRLGKSSWTQLPDRRVSNQSQYVLW